MTWLHRSVRPLVGLGLAVSLGACSAGPEGDALADGCEGAKCDAVEGGDDAADEARVCFGVRGNGQLIFAHFASLARIYETTGRLFWGASGGSSGSITTFLVDSIQLNSQLTRCGADACEEQEAANRAALLLKSLQGYVGVIGETDEAIAFLKLAPLAAKIQQAGLSELAASDAEAAREALLTILTSDDVADIVNDELIDMIATSPDPAFHIEDVSNAIAKIADFDATDDTIFVRPGIIDFEQFGEKVGRIASFYAGYGPADDAKMAQFLDSCATAGVGMTWSGVAELPAKGGQTCGSLFTEMLTEYRTKLLADEDAFHSRIDDEVGSGMHTLISTSVLEGDAVGIWRQAFEDYESARPHTLDIDFSDVHFGYFGAEEDLKRTASNAEGYDDLKTAKFRALGQHTWRTVLKYSPAEPGLTRAQELSETAVSSGGWSDLHPTLVLNNLGCDEIVYVTRQGKTSTFVSQDRSDPDAEPRGVATLLGLTDEEWHELYDLDAPSSFDLSLREADAVWCTNWNEQSAQDIEGTTADAYNAVLVSDDPLWTDNYEKHGDGAGLAGCASLTDADRGGK